MRRQIPSTATLIAFESAARHQSFTLAAQELHLSQSAVCRQIAQLEQQLGIRLFRRTRRGVTLTDTGEHYSRQIALRLNELERDTLSVMTRHQQGAVIELASVPTFATRWLLPRLAEFQQQHPNITINFTPSTKPFFFDDTGFDAALYHGEGAWPGTQAYFLMLEEALPVCSPALLKGQKTLSPSAIAQLPLLQQITRPYQWRQWFEQVNVKNPNDMMGPRFELFTMLAQAAVLQMGVALIPTMLIEQELASGQLVVIHPHIYIDTWGYHLITPDSRPESTALIDFRDWLIQATHSFTAPHIL